MKFVPHTRHGSLVLSGIEEVAHKENVSEEVTQKVVQAFSGHLEATEQDPLTRYKCENTKMAKLFHDWLEALNEGNHAKAKLIEQEIDTDLKNKKYDFPYAQTKQWYQYSQTWGYPLQASYQTALSHYRKPDPKNSQFGAIQGEVSPQAKIGIIGDWGTGTPDAKELFKEMLSQHPELEAILHLGDIYQCGTPYECARNFLDPINEVFQELKIPKIPIFTIPGNHEYFTAAEGYFQLIDVLNGDLDPKWKQEASFFRLRSSDQKWQFLGADTGLGCINHPREPGLLHEEVSWHQSQLNDPQFSGKSIFLTHHQFVSADSRLNHGASGDLAYYNKRLLRDFSSSLDKIDLWIWGHDHWFIPYIKDLKIPTGAENPPILKRGQLLGGSARETQVGGRTSTYLSAVEKDASGNQIHPQSTQSQGQNLSNHTYAIIDLKQSNISYYQVASYFGTDKPSGLTFKNPLLVQDLT